MNGYETWELEVPGKFDADVAMLDLETVKVPCDYRMANGELLKNRWGIIWAGVALDGGISLMSPGEVDDPLFLDALGDALTGTSAVVYAGTREFDEMICRGRFTTARRAHSLAAFYPAVTGAETLPWRRLRNGHLRDGQRAADCPSRDVPALLGYAPVGGGRKLERDVERVMVHLLRDVVELILLAGNPDTECASWCYAVLRSYTYAKDALFGDEPES